MPTNIINVMDAPYNAVGDGVADDSAAIQAAINAAQASSAAYGAPKMTVYAPIGHTFKIDSGLTISGTINLDIQSFLTYPNNSGNAVTIGTNTDRKNYSTISIAGIINTGSGASGGFPSSVNPGGPIGLRVNSLAFSRVYVGTIQGFSNCAIYLDGTGGQGYQQVIQHNTFELGQIVNNGYGILAHSTDAATSSAQANKFNIQNIYQNFTNIQLDSPSHIATTSNTFNINAMDNNSPINLGAHGVLNYGGFNHFEIGYMATDVYEGPSAQYNTYRVYNTLATGADWYPRPGGNSTYWRAG